MFNVSILQRKRTINCVHENYKIIYVLIFLTQIINFCFMNNHLLVNFKRSIYTFKNKQ